MRVEKAHESSPCCMKFYNEAVVFNQQAILVYFSASHRLITAMKKGLLLQPLGGDKRDRTADLLNAMVKGFVFALFFWNFAFFWCFFVLKAFHLVLLFPCISSCFRHNSGTKVAANCRLHPLQPAGKINRRKEEIQ